MSRLYVFVGERPSPRAEQIGATWQNGRLAARTLHLALATAGVPLDATLFVNLWQGAHPHDGDTEHAALICQCLQLLQADGWDIIALGRRVEQVLRTAAIPHRFAIHPAARGAIRRTATYQAHLQEVLR